jgi:hypothetical protein
MSVLENLPSLIDRPRRSRRAVATARPGEADVIIDRPDRPSSIVAPNQGMLMVYLSMKCRSHSSFGRDRIAPSSKRSISLEILRLVRTKITRMSVSKKNTGS